MYVDEGSDLVAQKALLDAVAGPAFFVDRDYRYLAFNEANRRAAHDLYGAELVVGSSLLEVVTVSEDRAALRSNLDRALAGETHSDGRWYGRNPDRGYFYTITYAPVVRGGEVFGVAAVAVDATELMKANRTLSVLSTMMESSDDAMVSWSADGTITSWSPGAERLTGYPAAERIGRPLSLFAFPGHDAEFSEVMRVVAAGDRVEHLATDTLRRDGARTEIDLTVGPVLDEAGMVVGATAVARDVSDLRTANAQLAREREFARTLIENLAEGVIACDADGTRTVMNRVARMANGLDADADPATDWDPGLHLYGPDAVSPLEPDDRPLNRALRGEHPRDQVLTLRLEGSEPRAMAVSGQAFFDEAGEKLGAVVVLRDVTEQQATMKALRRSEEKFEAAFRASPDAININRLSDGLYLDINAGFTSLTGFTREDVVGKTSLELAIWDDASQRDSLVAGLRARGCVDRLEARFRRKDGSVKAAEMSARIVDIDGDPCILSVTRDVSERRDAQAALEASYVRLERMSREVVQTLGRVVETRDPYTQGHELRVAELGRLIAMQMGMADREVGFLETAALVHDIGKLSVPAEILTKPGKLSAVEYNLIKEHPQHAYDILKDIAFDWPIAEIVLQHHERMDGSGYPHGLRGDEAHPHARILAVADVVEAMASHRPYRPALGLEAALDELRDNPDKYDRDVCAALFEICDAGLVLL